MVRVKVQNKVRVSFRVRDFWRAWQENNGNSVPSSTK